LLTISAGLLLLANATKPPRPLVIWHGTGESCCNEKEGTGRLVAYLRKSIPDLYIRAISVEDSNEEELHATYFGNILKQGDKVCKDLASDPKLKDGFDAVGFSLGGVHMRTYIQRCNKPRVHNFITYGTPNAGISSFPDCRAVDGVLCLAMQSIIKEIPYSDWAQNNAIHSQFYKDVNAMDTYMKKSSLLPLINNERAAKNVTYKKNFASLNKFVMISFTNENVVNPPQSAAFGYYKEGDKKTILSMKQQKYYKGDWFGLKTLDKQKKIVFDELPGKHMELSDKVFKDSLQKHLWSGKRQYKAS